MNLSYSKVTNPALTPPPPLSLYLSQSFSLSLFSEVQVEGRKVRNKLQLPLFHMMQKKAHFYHRTGRHTALHLHLWSVQQNNVGIVLRSMNGPNVIFSMSYESIHICLDFRLDTHGVPPRYVHSGSLCGEQIRLSGRCRDTLVKSEYSCKQSTWRTRAGF